MLTEILLNESEAWIVRSKETVTLIPRCKQVVRGRVETESGGTRRSTGGEVKGKEANGVGSQHSCTVSEHGLSSITTANAHTSAASSRLN